MEIEKGKRRGYISDHGSKKMGEDGFHDLQRKCLVVYNPFGVFFS